MLDSIRTNAQSWFIKLLFALIIIVFVFWGVSGLNNAPQSAAICTVNGEAITLPQFYRQLEAQMETIRAENPAMGQEESDSVIASLEVPLRDRMILETLLLQECARLGLVVTPQELRRAVGQMPGFQNEKGEFDPERYTAALKNRGMQPGEFEDELRRSFLSVKIRDAITGTVAVSTEEARDVFNYQAEQRVLDAIVFKTEEFLDRAGPAPEDVRAYYDGHPGEFQVPAQVDVNWLNIGPQSLGAGETVTDEEIEALYERENSRFARPERVRARHIVVLAPQDDKQADEAARKTIEDAAAQLRDGRDFAELAAEISQDGSARQGGELGWFAREQMVPEFSDAAFALAPGDLSEPVRTQYGWHLIRVDEHSPADTIPLTEVREELSRELAAEKAAPKVQDTLDNLLIAVINGQSLEDAAARYGLEVAGTGLVDISALGQSLGLKAADAQAIMNAPAGTTLDTAFRAGEAYLLVRVNASEPVKTQPFAEVESAIAERLRQESAGQLAQEAAAAARAAMADPELPAELNSRLTITPPLQRDGFAAGFASGNDQLAAAVFADSSQDWLPEPYAVNDGFALVRVREILPPDDALWQTLATQIVRSLTGIKQEKRFRAFLDDLYQHAQVAVHMQRPYTESRRQAAPIPLD
jgi:peptidyl-prolyl cis-trans isomerase D